MNKIRKGEVKIYKGKEYIAIPEIEEESCTGCCFYGKRLWLYSASGVLTVMMHGDREDNPIPEMLPNAGTNPDNIITTISGIGNDGGDW